MTPAGVPAPRVSVVVPVYRDAVRLEACLRALEAQTYRSLEVLVVDNDGSEPAVARVAEVHGARYVVETAPGSYAARNAGVREARGSIVAFTDADCEPEPEWVAQGVAALADADAVGGRIVVRVDDPGAPSVAADHDRLFAFRQEHTIRRKRYAVTANLFATAATLERVGPFDAALKSGGDVAWCRRLVALGGTLRYAAGAVVGHPARSSVQELLSKARRQAGGRVDASTGGAARLRTVLAHAVPPIDRVAVVLATTDLPWPRRLALAWLQVRLQSVLLVETLRVLSGRASTRA